MRKLVGGLTIVSFLMSGITAAHAESASSHSVYKDPSGAKIEKNAEASSGKTLMGNREMERHESVTVDPKGLGNKSETSRDRYTLKKGEGDYEAEDEIKHADGTLEKHTASRDTDGHWLDSGKTVTTEKKSVIDPPGLGNKTTKTSTVSKSMNPDGSQKTQVTTSVNGEEVSERTTTTR